MIDKIQDFFSSITWGAIKGAIQDAIKKQIVQWVMVALSTLFASWFAVKNIDAVNEAAMSDRNKTVIEEARKISAQQQSTHTVETIDPQVIKDAVTEALEGLPESFDREAYEAMRDSMADMKKMLIEVSTTLLNVNLGSTTQVVDKHVEDDFLTGDLKHDSTTHTDSLKWKLTAKLGAIATRFENIEGQMAEITSYWLQSTKNPNKAMFLDSIIKRTTAKIIVPEDLSKMWIDHALSAGVFIGKELTVGLAYSPFLISSGGRTPKATIIRYPVIALSTDFKTSTTLALGIAVNV